MFLVPQQDGNSKIKTRGSTLSHSAARAVVSDLCWGGKEQRHTGRDGPCEWKALQMTERLMGSRESCFTHIFCLIRLTLLPHLFFFFFGLNSSIFSSFLSTPASLLSKPALLYSCFLGSFCFLLVHFVLYFCFYVHFC